MRRQSFKTRRITVAYWTAADDNNGSCSPSGRAIMRVSDDYDTRRIENLKRFKRKNGESKIYDISE